MLHARRGLLVLCRRSSVHVRSGSCGRHGRTQNIWAPHLPQKPVRTVYCARRGGHCYRLVDLYGSRVALMGRLLFALLSLVVFAVALLSLALDMLFLLRGMLLQDMRLHHLALTQLTLAVGTCLLR